MSEQTAEATAPRDEQEAAEAALARAGSPPEDFTNRVASGTARADGGDVAVVADEYRESVDKFAHGKASDVDMDDVALATEWLLSDEQQVNTRKLSIRIGGSDDAPTMGGWVIRAVPVDVIRQAEREAVGNRAARRGGTTGPDELIANLRIVAEGTVEPDVKALARQKGLADPTVLLRQRFQFRSGVLAQIAGEVMSLSGFDSEDVRAAGNS